MTKKPNTKINESLAKANGWKVDSKPTIADGLYYGFPPSGDPYQLIPDFCSDWKYAGPLLEEILERHGRMEFGHEFFMVHLAKHGKHDGATLTEAIARAREAMIEEGE